MCKQRGGYEILQQQWLISACQSIAKRLWVVSLTYCGKCMPFCISQGEQLHNAITLDQKQILTQQNIHRQHFSSQIHQMFIPTHSCNSSHSLRQHTCDTVIGIRFDIGWHSPFIWYMPFSPKIFKSIFIQQAAAIPQ